MYLKNATCWTDLDRTLFENLKTAEKEKKVASTLFENIFKSCIDSKNQEDVAQKLG